ncbi:hypothetical protein LIER_25854 [Lithospermum erythrorhizon]|uniref:Uncharacterized protein n=1 Tax=Lithospermum erythrorhizon TaxID=34254 RepID=A0AAV3R9K6_LITER
MTMFATVSRMKDDIKDSEIEDNEITNIYDHSLALFFIGNCSKWIKFFVSRSLELDEWDEKPAKSLIYHHEVSKVEGIRVQIYSKRNRVDVEDLNLDRDDISLVQTTNRMFECEIKPS